MYYLLYDEGMKIKMKNEKLKKTLKKKTCGRGMYDIYLNLHNIH